MEQIVLPHLNLREQENDARARQPTKTSMKARSSDETPSSSKAVVDEDTSAHDDSLISDECDETDHLRKEVEDLSQKPLARVSKNDHFQILLTESRRVSITLKGNE